jgi:beta-ureidopropionase
MFKIALAQFVASEDRKKNRTKGEKMVADAAKAGAELVAFPEMAFDPFFPQHSCDPQYFDWAEKVPGPTTKQFATAAKKNKIDVFINIFQEVERAQYFDATIAIDKTGQVQGYSQMMHVCETPGFHEKYYYWDGTTDFPVFDIGERAVGPCICYDRHFPEVMRILALKGAEVIVVQTATSADEAGTILEAEMRAAAMANGVYVALVNRAGKDGAIDFAGRSFVVDPYGEILVQSDSDQDDLLVVELDLDEIRKARQAWPLLRDRRPELYDMLMIDLEKITE